MIYFELPSHSSVVSSEKFVLFLPFNPHFCVMYLLNMQKESTQILYQYLGTKVVVAGELAPPSTDGTEEFYYG